MARIGSHGFLLALCLLFLDDNICPHDNNYRENVSVDERGLFRETSSTSLILHFDVLRASECLSRRKLRLEESMEEGVEGDSTQ